MIVCYKALRMKCLYRLGWFHRVTQCLVKNYCGGVDAFLSEQ